MCVYIDARVFAAVSERMLETSSVIWDQRREEEAPALVRRFYYVKPEDLRN